ncbi:MAG: hypothetical protein LBD04_12790 [Synergistaceae bacterium]|nr:hypothetical protein [Synergistaceae bacterium]
MITGIPYMIACAFLLYGLFLVLRVGLKKNEEFEEGRKGKNAALRFVILKSACSFGMGVVFIIIGSFLFYAEPGYIYFIQYPWGSISVISDPGYHVTPFAVRYSWQKFITIKLGDIDESTSDTQSLENNSIKGVRFNDAVSANVSISARFSLPTETEPFAKLHTEYRSERRLIDSTLVPSVYESIRNGMRLISAQEYVSGRGGVLEEAFKDQLENGLYSMSIKDSSSPEIRRSLTKEGESNTVDEVNLIIEPKKDGEGNIERVKTASLKEKGIGVSLAVIENIEFEQTFLDRLENQKKASTAAAQAAQEVKQAEQERLKAIAEGEKAKAIEKAEYEKLRIKVVTEAETERQRAEIAKQTAEILRQKAQVEAETKVITAKAEAESKELIVKADNNLSLKIEAIKYLADRYADAIKGKQLVPTVYIGGGEGGGIDASEALLKIITALTATNSKLLNLDLDVGKPVNLAP